MAVCWLGIGGAIATLCGLLCKCMRVYIGAALWQCVRHDGWFSRQGGDTFLMVFKSRWRIVGFDLSPINYS